MSKVIYSYVREDGRPFACVASIGPGAIGVSVCSPKDTFQKHLAREIATGRAIRNASRGIPIDESYNSTNKRRSRLIREAIQHMQRRAEKYFQQN